MTFDTSQYSADDNLAPAQSRRGTGFLDRLIPAFEAGHLQIVLPSGTVFERHGPNAGPEATIVMHRWKALWRMLAGGENGFSDGYIGGDWSSPDIGRLLDFFMQNEAAFAARAEPSWLGRVRDRVMHRQNANTKRGSRRNIASHYDLGNEFYRYWLDDGMNYSSALYRGNEPLEAAQDNKIDRIAELLSLSGGERVLEIGCGWGALAERLVRRHNCNLVGLTLSTEQRDYARERLAAEVDRGHTDIRLQDYRDGEGHYDRIVSIEMLEAVGEKYWPIYFSRLAARLAKGGVAVLQVITLEESRFPLYRRRPDFIQRYIFPGGMLPTVGTLEQEAGRAGLVLTHQEPFGASYARTLQEWRKRFIDAWPDIHALGFDDKFRRMWEYYLAYCEAGFRRKAIDVHLFRFVQTS